ncbi:MAG TPA: polysaccharide lyase family 7 protein [Opitutaceae bacterium]|nr:polysaccharide lyase family 7 protein [Opitutaceae bacterium]
MKSRSLVLCLALLPVAATGFAAGWTEQPLKYSIQWPYDLKEDARYSFKDGVHDFVVYKTDKPLRPGSTTEPRTEMKIENDYSSGIHRFEADVYVPAGTSGVSIMQVFGGTNGHATSLQLRVYDGNLMRYRFETLKKNVYDRWFHLDVVHNVATREIQISIDGAPPFTARDNGGSSHYFKCGVYTQDNPSDRMEARFKNIKIYTQ